MARDREHELYGRVCETEFTKLRTLKNPGNAALALLYLKAAKRGIRSIGCRQIATGTGLSKDQASRALRDLIDAKLIEKVKNGSSAGDGHVACYEIMHWDIPEKPSHQCDRPKHKRRTSATPKEKTVAPVRQRRQKPSRQCDIYNTASSASPSRRKDEEAVLVRRRRHRVVRQLRHQWHRETKLNRERAQNERIGRAAEAIPVKLIEFKEKAGGWSAADFLARKYDRGELTPRQLRARLAESSAGLGKTSGSSAPQCASPTSCGSAGTPQANHRAGCP